MPPEADTVKRARTSCFACRKSKRRCDKKLPICNLCTKKEIQCEYPARHGASSVQAAQPTAPSPIDWMSDISSTNGNASNQDDRNTSLSFSSFVESDVNAIYFLAPHIFQQTKLEIPRLHPPILVDLSSILGDTSSVRDIAVKYFTNIHRWLPIVYKRGFFASLLNPLAQRQIELKLLILCMKLCCTSPSGPNGKGDADTELYRLAKKLHFAVESTAPLSIQVLQAGVLIALYELGQAIYPAAYLTVGACARYGLALGINYLSVASPGTSKDDIGTSQLWNELEEKRRVWWAVLMFDRYLSLSNPSRPLSTENPSFDSYLPVDDTAWDNGTVSFEHVASISSGFTLKMGSFARLAQATYLLSQALRSISPTPIERDLTEPDGTAQLRRTLLSLVHAADSETAIRRLEFCAQSEFSFSTILLLQEDFLKEMDTRPSQENAHPSLEGLYYEAQSALSRLSAAAFSYNNFCPHNPDACDNVPIFLIHAMYQVSCIYLAISRGTPSGEVKNNLDTIKELLQLIEPRWKLAGMYLKILEAREVAASLDNIKTRANLFRIHHDPVSVLQQGLVNGDAENI